jgi:hypothetical protein
MVPSWRKGTYMTGREELFEAYEATIVSTLDPADPDPETAWVDPALICALRQQRACVITAWNPGFERPGDEVNRQRNDLLRARLAATGSEVWRADGSAADGSFAEEGFLAWGLPTVTALQVAREFEQFAIYEYDEDGVRRVIAC